MQWEKEKKTTPRMNKLPPTPPKPPPPSPSSLPPRPPPSQRNAISILPALPMAHHQKQKRKFPVQGIGRGGGGLQGHASLPLKPGIPGKLLPRDTGPIVLTGGGNGDVAPGGFSYSHVAKRTYPPTGTKTESPTTTTTRRESVMTALAPASQTQATSPVHLHRQLIPVAITPPAEVMTRPFLNQASSLMNYGSEFNDAGACFENQTVPQNGVDAETQVGNDLATSNSCTEPAYLNSFRPDMVSQHPNFLSFPHPNFYDNGHENSFHLNRNFAHLNGHDAPMPNGPMSDGYPPYILPPPLPPPHSHSHHMYPQHQNRHHQGFIHHPFPGDMTPPNTGTLFAPPPPFQPHGTLDDSNQTSEMSGSTNPQTPFTPTHSFPVHLDLQHPHPQHSVFPLPPDRMVHFDNLHQGQHQQQQTQVFGNTLETSLDAKTRYLSVTESNPILRTISFFPPDSDQLHDASPAGKIDHHDHNSNENGEARSEDFGSRVDSSQDPPNRVAAHRLQTYCLGYYLSDRLADVNLFVKQIGEEFEWSERFNAHSFVLGRSTKLARLIEDTIERNEEQALADTSFFETAGGLNRSAPRVDEMDSEHLAPTTRTTSSRKVTVLLETGDKYLSRDSFLLTLRWLYGGEDWELDAYLDPSHPKYRTLEWTRENAGDVRQGNVGELITGLESISLDNFKEVKSEEVHMLERSFALLAAGTLLGVDEVIDKGTWGIRRWGMRFEGGAFERLLAFALEGGDYDEALANGVREPEAKYGMFKKHLLDETTAFLVKGLPNPFKFDPRAPASKYLVRLPENPHQSSTSLPTPERSVVGDFSNSETLREAYSTVFLSMPFDLLRTFLEHDGFATRSGDRRGITRYDIAKAVVHERERRRKYCFKVARERRVSICSETAEVGITDGRNTDPNSGSNMASVPPSEKEELESENLYWEESVLCTFGHGGNGLEITRRRKGGNNGGRVLWKVGDAPVKI